MRIAAVSVDPPDVTREHVARQGYTYLFLSDSEREVIRRWDLVHEGGAQESDIARPAEFLIDPDGFVRWRNLTESFRIRPKGEEILEALEGAGLKR